MTQHNSRPNWIATHWLEVLAFQTGAVEDGGFRSGPFTSQASKCEGRSRSPCGLGSLHFSCFRKRQRTTPLCEYHLQKLSAVWDSSSSLSVFRVKSVTFVMPQFQPLIWTKKNFHTESGLFWSSLQSVLNLKYWFVLCYVLGKLSFCKTIM